MTAEACEGKLMEMNYCDGCVYRETVNGYGQMCAYILRTGHRRPCPPGDGFTARVKRTVYRRRRKNGKQTAAQGSSEEETR